MEHDKKIAGNESGGDDEGIRDLLGYEPASDESDRRVGKAMRRARATVGQRDTLLFALVRFWTTLAKLLAPVFASLARAQAQAGHGRAPRKK